MILGGSEPLGYYLGNQAIARLMLGSEEVWWVGYYIYSNDNFSLNAAAVFDVVDSAHIYSNDDFSLNAYAFKDIIF